MTSTTNDKPTKQEQVDAYRQRLADKAEALTAAAERRQAEADARMAQAKATADMIPFGQPMMPGHHSYRSDRNRRQRMRDNFGKAVDLQQEAAELAKRAERVGKNGISSNDPEAVEKLEAKVARLERDRDRMKAANKAIKAGTKAGLDGEALAAKVAEAAGCSIDTARKALTPDPMGRVGFPSYALTNIGAEIRRARKRIAELSTHDLTDGPEVDGDGWSIRTVDGSIVLGFDERIAEDLFRQIRGSGWNWSPRRGAFVRKDTPAARAAVPGTVRLIGGEAS